MGEALKRAPAAWVVIRRWCNLGGGWHQHIRHGGWPGGGGFLLLAAAIPSVLDHRERYFVPNPAGAWLWGEGNAVTRSFTRAVVVKGRDKTLSRTCATGIGSFAVLVL